MWCLHGVRHLAGVQLGHRLGGGGAGDNLLFGFLWRFRFKVGKAFSPVARKNTGGGLLHCFPDCRAISQSYPGSYRRAPETTTQRRNVA
jgi:hypothetical protein